MRKIQVPVEFTKYLLPMHPIVFISTVDSHGCDNLGVFATCLDVSYTPPMILFASNKTQHTLLGERVEQTPRAQDTFENITSTENFIINIPGISLIPQMNIIARPFAKEIDEFERANLTKYPALGIYGRHQPKIVGECLAHLECKLNTIVNPSKCDHYLVLGEVICASVDISLGTSLEEIRQNLTPQVFGNLRADKDGKRIIGKIIQTKVDSVIFSTDSYVFNNRDQTRNAPYQQSLFDYSNN